MPSVNGPSVTDVLPCRAACPRVVPAPCPLTWLTDTGSDIDAISFRHLSALGGVPADLSQDADTVYTADGRSLSSLGKVSATLFAGSCPLRHVIFADEHTVTRKGHEVMDSILQRTLGRKKTSKTNKKDSIACCLFVPGRLIREVVFAAAAKSSEIAKSVVSRHKRSAAWCFFEENVSTGTPCQTHNAKERWR